MMAKSPAAVAAAFSSSSGPVCPGDSRWAAIPEPITTAASNPLPSNSARSRRHSAIRSPVIRSWVILVTTPVRSGAAGTGLRPVVLTPEGLAVGQDRVDLPPLTVRGALDPELVLPGVAAGGVPLARRGEPGLSDPGVLGLDRPGIGHLDAEVVEAATLARVLQQDELEGWLGDSEVGVPGPALGGLGAEQGGVERDGLVDVVDVKGELHTGHGYLPEVDIDPYLCLSYQ